MHPSPQLSALPILQGNDSLLSTLIAASPLAIFLLDLEERVQLWNPAAERIFGWRAEEVIGGRNPMVPPDRWDEADALMRLILRGESVTEREVRRRRKDGSLLDVGLSAARLCDQDGRPRGIMVIAADISDRRRLEEERANLLRRERLARAQAEAAERRARLLAEASLLLDSSLDLPTTLQNLASFSVPALADCCMIDELVGNELNRVASAHVDPERARWSRPRTRQLSALCERNPVVRALRTEESVLVEELTEELVDMLCEGDPVVREGASALGIHSFLVVPLMARGRTLGTLTLASTSSERPFAPADVEMAEELARRAATAVDTARLYHQARQAVRARERLLALVSHDLRNSLATVMLNASAILERPEPDAPLGEPERDQLRWITRSSEQMSHLIDDLLDVSTIESGGLSIRPALHDVRGLLREAVHLTGPLAVERGVSLEIETGEESLRVHLDYERVQQVLANLLGNAVKFSPAGGAIQVGASLVEGELQVRVSDEGPGVPTDVRETIFDLFWQGRHDRKRGAGLGLAISRGIVAAHGGRIWVESRPEGGSAFVFTLPAITVEAGG